MKKHKLLCVLLALCILMLPACGKEKSLLEGGLQVAAMLDKLLEKNAGKYFKDEKLIALGESHADGEYSMFDTVYRITFEEEKLYEYLDLGNMELWPEMKPAMQRTAVLAALDTVNMMEESGASLFVRMFPAEITFKNSELEELCVYLYTFKNGSPVAVVFSAAGDGEVFASGQFLAVGESVNICTGLLEEWFAELGPTAEVIAGT